MTTTKTKFHRNNDVTVWDVHSQQWHRMPASAVSSRILASLPRSERARVQRAAAGLNS